MVVTSEAPGRLFLVVSILYLFFNNFLLPDGLLYTTLLTPFFLMQLLRHKGWQVYGCFLILSTGWALIQYPSVDYFRAYAQSFLLLQCVAIFTINAWYVIREWRQQLVPLLKVLGSINMVLLGIAALCLFIPFFRSQFWYEMSMSEGLPVIPRLKMLTYEASYYSLIITPVFAYYLFKKILLRSRTGILWISLVCSLVLSLSFGVLAGILLALSLVFLLNLNELIRRVNLNYLMAGMVLCGLVLVALLLFYPHNMLFDRLRNIFSGNDTSARGRTYESFILAWNVAKMKSLWWGIGPGQLKMIGRDYIIQYYQYSNIPSVIRIPNAVAETLNQFGIIGLLLRFATLAWLFFKTRVWDNYYRLFLFLFMFIYQFTGSFLFNPVEYITWILAFSRGIFPVFDRIHFIQGDISKMPPGNHKDLRGCPVYS